MNVLTILIDTLNRNYLSCYGNDWINTPNIQRLADKGVVFDNHYIGSAPCMPARREFFTGRKQFLWRGWGQLEPFDDHLAIMANDLGVKTTVVTDHYHYWDMSHGYGYIQPFQEKAMITGQESDRIIAPAVKEEDLPQWAKSISKYMPEKFGMRYYRNVMNFKTEEDFHCAQVMSKGAQAIENTIKGDPNFMLIENFDPHDPWYVPEPYRSMYGPYSEEYSCWAPYVWPDRVERFFEQSRPEELEFLRQQYAGNVTMVDHQLGKVFDALDKRNLWDDAVVILTTDHGHELGEHRCFGKAYPHWNTHANIPLIIWHPKYPGHRRADAFSNITDIHSTIMELLGGEDYHAPDGRSLMPVLSGQKQQVRDGVLYGTYGLGACWSDEDFSFFSGYDNDRSLPYWYSTKMFRDNLAPDASCGKFVPGVDHPVWRFPCPYRFDHPRRVSPQIFSHDDWHQLNDLSADRNLLRECRERLKAAMDEETAPPEQYRRLLLED